MITLFTIKLRYYKAACLQKWDLDMSMVGTTTFYTDTEHFIIMVESPMSSLFRAKITLKCPAENWNLTPKPFISAMIYICNSILGEIFTVCLYCSSRLLQYYKIW